MPTSPAVGGAVDLRGLMHTLPQQLGFELYGARARVSTSTSELMDRVIAFLPPVWTRCAPDDRDLHFTLCESDHDRFTAALDGEELVSGSLDVVLDVLDSSLRGRIAYLAPEKIFVHAGAVGWGKAAILIPGLSMSGKTSLVAALVRGGASYLSDEYAVLDDDGLIHPYARPLSIRGDDEIARDCHVAEIGGTIAQAPLPVATIVVTRYDPAASWQPRRLSPAEAMLELLRHTIPTQDRPAQTLAALHRVVGDSIALEGARGDADETAMQLLRQLQGADDGLAEVGGF
jgi:hypothetical protein